MKTVLIVCYEFPPGGGAGIKRTLKFLKFLPDYGWRGCVLAARNGNYHIVDRSLENEVPSGVNVYRGRTLEMKPAATVGTPSVSVGQAPPSGPGAERRGTRPLHRLYRRLGALIKAPDSRILWLPGALAAGLRAVRKERPEVIYASGPSFTNLIVGVWLGRLTRRPVVLDFRDAWVADPTLRAACKPYLFRLHAAQERRVIRAAHRVIATNPAVMRDFQERYPECPATRFMTIFNGFDRDDFIRLASPAVPVHDRFTLVYTGRLYAERTPRYFLEALAQAFQEVPDMRRQTRVLFVGSCEPFLDGRRTEDYLVELGLNEVVELTGQVSRAESLAYQETADVLLLIIGRVSEEGRFTYGISGKVFDYLASQKPILTLADEGATRDLVTRHGIGEVFAHEDVTGIRDALIRQYRAFQAGTRTEGTDLERYREFDCRFLTQSLAACLDETAREVPR